MLQFFLRERFRPLIVLNSCAKDISLLAEHIFQQQGYFPIHLRVHLIFIIQKSGSYHHTGNFWPINNVSQVCRLFEAVIHDAVKRTYARKQIALPGSIWFSEVKIMRCISTIFFNRKFHLRSLVLSAHTVHFDFWKSCSWQSSHS